MPTANPAQPLSADDAEIRVALAEAHLPSLLPALAQLTGDMSLLRSEFRPNPAPLSAEEQGGMDPTQIEAARTAAFKAITGFREGGSKSAPPPDNTAVHQMVDFLTGGQSSEEYVPLLLEELAFPKEDARAPKWSKTDLAPASPFSVAIVGAGMSGILAAIRLKQAGVPFIIIEKNDGVGGTWFENTYPGARVDNPNHGYSYSFAQKPDWPFHFSPQGVLRDYFREVAENYGLLGDVYFQTEVTSAEWDEVRQLWEVHIRSASGKEETIEAQAVISAVGQLNRPKLPEIKGTGSFEGPSFHSARWDHGIDLHGKRVAVIGNGASASQFIPVVAEQAESLTIFQRTPNWYAPNPNYHAAVGDGLQWIFRHIPHAAQWYRFSLFWTSAEGILPMAKVEPGWDAGEVSVGAANDQLREMFTAYLDEQFSDRPDLQAKVIPRYPPASKRIVVDNGIWPATLKRPNVRLVTEPISELTPRGVRTVDGEEHSADVVIYGTGFHASKFLMPMKLVGRNGADLHAQWDGDARAYMGVTVPNFPNLFMLYGPNTNIVVNGSIVYFSECEVTYVLDCLRELFEGRHNAMDCRQEVHDAYNVRIDRGNLEMAWGVSKVNSWYKNEKGRVAQNWPFTLLEFWQQTKKVDPADYVFS